MDGDQGDGMQKEHLTSQKVGSSLLSCCVTYLERSVRLPSQRSPASNCMPAPHQTVTRTCNQGLSGSCAACEDAGRDVEKHI
eukprot:15879-Eustigmatos_ZCMA.PRE.1